MVKVTHIDFTEEIRTLGTMRAAQLRLRLSEYLTKLIVEDARKTGLLDYLEGSPTIDGKQGGV